MSKLRELIKVLFNLPDENKTYTLDGKLILDSIIYKQWDTIRTYRGNLIVCNDCFKVYKYKKLYSLTLMDIQGSDV